MVRVASLASFPKGTITREFYAFVPLEGQNEDVAKEKDRLRQMRNRQQHRRRKAMKTILFGAPPEVLAAMERNSK